MKKCSFKVLILFGFVCLFAVVFEIITINQIHKERNNDYNDPAYFVKYPRRCADGKNQ